MNRIIEQQLKKVKEADVTHYDVATNSFIIPKKQTIRLEENKCYIIELEDRLLNDSLQVLVNNWNKGVKPTCKWYRAEMTKVTDSMVMITGVGYDYKSKTETSGFFSGWLPKNGIKILERI